MEEAFRKHEIFPNVVLVAPTATVTVKYAAGIEVDRGNTLRPSEVAEEPEVVEWKAAPSALYTLVLTDPDVPSRAKPTSGQVIHWLVINIPGSRIPEGDVLGGYFGSGPSADTGLHRYVFLVYKQAHRIEGLRRWRITRRLRRKVADFAAEHALGTPVAGNFFQVRMLTGCYSLASSIQLEL